LKKQVPEYMVPSAFQILESLPRLANGKVDRKALPKPDGTRWESQTAYLAPRTDTEIRIARIWQDVLQLERVGSRDNFFDLGGHSLLPAPSPRRYCWNTRPSAAWPRSSVKTSRRRHRCPMAARARKPEKSWQSSNANCASSEAE
jgi:hypothetical protein